MKQIQQDIIQAIRENRNFHSGSASGSGYARKYGLVGDRDKYTIGRDHEFRYELWGNGIAFGNTGIKKLYVSSCGYVTPTTVSRLNAVFAGFDIPMTAVIRDKRIRYTLNGRELCYTRGAKILAGNWIVKLV